VVLVMVLYPANDSGILSARIDTTACYQEVFFDMHGCAECSGAQLHPGRRRTPHVIVESHTYRLYRVAY
jgi:hypothetical protein